MKCAEKQKGPLRGTLHAVYVIAALALLAGVYLPPITPNFHVAVRSAVMQTSRSIALCLFQYAVDHNGHFPEGKSSTEVFQKLIDGKYIQDPSIFFIPYLEKPGKVRPKSDQLKPENVCWDVTCCVDSTAPEGLPVVFVTGYKVFYRQGASATPILPQLKQTWFQRYFDKAPIIPPFGVTFVTSSPSYGVGLSRSIEPDDGGTIANFIPPDFDPKGKVYRQLTPDGPLP